MGMGLSARNSQSGVPRSLRGLPRSRLRCVVGREQAVEVRDGPSQSFGEVHAGLPVEQLLSHADLGPPLHRVVARQRREDELRRRAGEIDDESGEIAHGELLRIADVHRPGPARVRLHEPVQAGDHVVDEAEAARP